MSMPLDPSLRELNDCGCCEGIHTETPQEVKNRPGLSAIAYRVGTHNQFKESLLAALSDSARTALANLKTRDETDFSIALLDAWAMVADVLTFYQERFINESYLRTATERRSVLELARLIGYELNPGVAASAYLSFVLENAAGAPGEATLGKGIKVQSLPGPGEQPQTFETIEQLDARAEWNAMTPRESKPINLGEGATEAYLAGVATNLKAGDGLLFVGTEREKDALSDRWDFRLLQTVELDAATNLTRVTWERGLGSLMPHSLPSAHPKIFTMRQRASVFGSNAPDWRTMLDDWKRNYLGVGREDPLPTQWPDFVIFTPTGKTPPDATGKSETIFSPDTIDLNAVYPQIIQGSWLILSAPTYAELYKVTKVVEAARADFTLTGKTSRVTLSGENLKIFEKMVRSLAVFAQSEVLMLAEVPLTGPIQGNTISLNRRLVKAPAENGRLIARGRRQRAQVASTARNVKFTDLSGAEMRKLKPGEMLFVLAPGPDIARQDEQRWHLLDTEGVDGYVTATWDILSFVASQKEDVLLSELVTLKETTLEDAEHTRLVLTQELKNVYERAGFSLSANVAQATHGETTAEVLGNGDAASAYQRFSLKQSPLTYTSAATPSGGQSTLSVYVNELKWNETPTLYGRGPRERVYTTRTDDDGKTTVQFGDGRNGARPPTGRENVRATYRKGIGRAGLVKADQLSLLMTRPLGVKGVTNPLPSAGAQDPQQLADARRNAPLTVLTFDRLVSLRDYEDFARSFSGIAKALATWTWNSHARGVLVTVAGPNGDAVPDDGDLHDKLITTMQQLGDERTPLQVKNYRKATFKINATVKSDPAYTPEKVLDAVAAALLSNFSFEARAFGQAVALSEVIAVMQTVDGVVAVDVDKLYRSDAPAKLHSHLVAEMPQPGADAATPGAELLLLDLKPLADLGVML